MSPERQRESEPPFPTVSTSVDGLCKPLLQAKRGYRFGPENLVWPTILREYGHAHSRERERDAPSNSPSDDVTIVDLGAGCGILGLLAAQATHGGRVSLTLVERNADHAQLCRHNAQCTEAVVTVVEADLREWDADATATLVVANPPFFRAGEGQPSRHATTRESTHAHHGGVHAFAQAIARTLARTPGSEGWLLYPANQLADAMHAAQNADLHVTGLWLLFSAHKVDAAAYRAWLRLSHQAAPLEIREIHGVGSSAEEHSP
ncbi:MAG: tRNA1(Val) A37 N6-methylase TrmN6 [Bradymonadia bacterium]|jgi:tRNA1(Val) A37 N6-methylase TrmN6